MDLEEGAEEVEVEEELLLLPLLRRPSTRWTPRLTPTRPSGAGLAGWTRREEVKVESFL